MKSNTNIFKYTSLSKIGQHEDSISNITKLLVNKSIKPIVEETDKEFGEGYVRETIIPIVIKLCDYNIKKFPNETWLFKDYIKFLNTKKSSIKNEDVVNLYCESLIKKLKNKGEK